jgi:hypothetical protein
MAMGEHGVKRVLHALPWLLAVLWILHAFAVGPALTFALAGTGGELGRGRRARGTCPPPGKAKRQRIQAT